MSTKTLVGIWLALAFILAGATRLFAQAPDDVRAIVSFQRAADEYAFLHRRIEREQPPIEIGSDAETLNRAIESMAAALRAARPDAREGDLFAPPVRGLLRAKIGAALNRSGLGVADLVPAMEETDSPVVRVHGAMPWKNAADMPPTVLAALPELPPELQYRFVGGDLVLVDVHASLIVDILRAPASDTR